VNVKAVSRVLNRVLVRGLVGGGARSGLPGREVRRSWSLRDADWRFLVPSASEGEFGHVVVLGATPDVARTMLDCGLANRVSSSLSAGELADAIIVHEGARADLPAVRKSLRAGGILYLEVNRRCTGWRGSSPARLQWQLDEAGFTTPRFYWVRPNFSARKVLLPLDCPEALRWYVETTLSPSTFRQRLEATVLRSFVAQSTDWLSALVPHYAATAVAGVSPPEPPALLGAAGLPARLRDPDLRPIVISNGADEFNRIAVLPFHRDARHPLAALKVARVPERNVHNCTEQKTLASLRQGLCSDMSRTIPEPLGTARWGPLLVTIESYLPGSTLQDHIFSRRLSQRQAVERFEYISNWLAALNAQAQVRRTPWNDHEIRQWVEEPLRSYESVVGTTGEEAELFARLRERAQQIRGASVPIVWQHGSLGPWNICLSDSGIGVYDWEGAEHGLPLSDLIYFSYHWFITLRRSGGSRDRLRDFATLFCAPDASDSRVRTVRQSLDRHLLALGTDVRFRPIPLIILWTLHAVGRAERIRQLGLDARNRKARNNTYVAMVRLMARHAEQVFSPS
jgi:hypothetical protein